MTGLPPELVSAVLADPNDPAPRLACADWLDEHGDPDAAAFIRIDVRIMREGELSLGTREVGRLRREAAPLLAAHLSRWALGPIGLAEGRGVTFRWHGGFVYGLTVAPACRTPVAQLLPRLRAFPLLGQLDLRTREPLPVSVLAALPALPRLAAVTLDAPGPGLDDAAVAVLAAQPRLKRVCLRRREPGARSATLRFPEPDGWARVLAARAARLAAVPAESLADALEPFARQVRRSRRGDLLLDLSATDGVALAGGDALSRLPGLAVLEGHGPAVPGWLSAHPRLVGLTLLGLESFDPAPLAGLRELRYVHLSTNPLPVGERAALTAWLESLPRLAALRLHPSWPIHARLPGLRSLSLPTPAPELDAPNLVEASDHPIAAREPGPAESFGGITIRPPAGFRRVESPDDGETLATWVEWGDGDPRDRFAPAGPAWVRLELVPFRVLAADALRVLRAPPAELDPSIWLGAARRNAGAYCANGGGPFAEHFRLLWLGERSALRLRLERPYQRLTPAAPVARAFADSVEWDGA